MIEVWEIINNSYVILLVRFYISFDVLQYVTYLFLQVTPCQPLFDTFHRDKFTDIICKFKHTIILSYININFANHERNQKCLNILPQ